MVASALISAGATLLGGLFGRKKAVSAGDNAYSHVGGIMRAASQYGFNPLTLLGAVAPMGGTPADNSAFGQAVANAGMIAADAIAAKPDNAAKLNAYQTQNQRLQRKLNALSVRSPVPGTYGRARQPSDPEVYGGRQGAGALFEAGGVADTAGAAGGPSPLVDGQAVTEKGTEEISGFMRVRNKFAPDGFFVPGSDGEPLDIWQLPVVVGAYAVDRGVRMTSPANGRWLNDKLRGAMAGLEHISKTGMSYGKPLDYPALPDRPYRLYGLPRDTSARFAPMPTTRKPKPKRRDMFGTLGFQ